MHHSESVIETKILHEETGSSAVNFKMTNVNYRVKHRVER